MLIKYDLKQDLILILTTDTYKSLLLSNIVLDNEEYLDDVWFDTILLHRYIDGLYIVENNMDKKQLPNHLSRVSSFLSKNKLSLLYLHPSI